LFEYKKGIPKTIKVFQRNPLCFLNLSLFVVSLQKSCIYSFSSKRDGYKVFQGKQSFPKIFLTKMVFEGRATTQTKSIFSEKKNHFETKNAKFVSFQKMVDKKKPF
jgi:hypothetical protein